MNGTQRNRTMLLRGKQMLLRGKQELLRIRIKSDSDPIRIGSDSEVVLRSVGSDPDRIFKSDFNRIRIRIFQYPIRIRSVDIFTCIDLINGVEKL